MFNSVKRKYKALRIGFLRKKKCIEKDIIAKAMLLRGQEWIGFRTQVKKKKNWYEISKRYHSDIRENNQCK